MAFLETSIHSDDRTAGNCFHSERSWRWNVTATVVTVTLTAQLGRLESLSETFGKPLFATCQNRIIWPQTQWLPASRPARHFIAGGDRIRVNELRVRRLPHHAENPAKQHVTAREITKNWHRFQGFTTDLRQDQSYLTSTRFYRCHVDHTSAASSNATPAGPDTSQEPTAGQRLTSGRDAQLAKLDVFSKALEKQPVADRKNRKFWWISQGFIVGFLSGRSRFPLGPFARIPAPVPILTVAAFLDGTTCRRRQASSHGGLQ